MTQTIKSTLESITFLYDKYAGIIILCCDVTNKKCIPQISCERFSSILSQFNPDYA